MCYVYSARRTTYACDAASIPRTAALTAPLLLPPPHLQYINPMKEGRNERGEVKAVLSSQRNTPSATFGSRGRHLPRPRSAPASRTRRLTAEADKSLIIRYVMLHVHVPLPRSPAHRFEDTKLCNTTWVHYTTLSSLHCLRFALRCGLTFSSTYNARWQQT